MAVKTLQNLKQNRPAQTKSVKERRPKRREMDYTFLLLVVVMVCAGLIMLLSASAPAANVKFGNSYYFFIRQLSFAGVGFAAMIAISRIDYHKLKPFAKLFMIICTVLLALVLIPGIGIEENESRRWLKFGIRFQPSEFMKLAIGMYFARMIEDSKKDLSKIRNMTPYLFWIGVVSVLMLLETHVSGTIVICGIAVTVLLAGGANFKFFLGCGLAAVPAGLVFLMKFPKRWGRIISFLNPFADTQAKGYQVVQGLYAIGSGGIFGLGLGQSVQKYSYLPEPYNDFIFSIICEELGFVGMGLVIGLFIAVIVRGIKIAFDAPDTFGCLTVVGIMAQIGIQTVMNIAVVTSSIPNTGVPLPFFSYGGTAIMVLLAEMGIVLSVSRYRREKELPGITTETPKKKTVGKRRIGGYK